MKKFISLLLALSILFVLCACSPNIEEITVEANRFVATNPYVESYCAVGEYDEDYNCYFVLVYVNEDVLIGTEYSKNSLEGKAIMGMMANSEDSDAVMNYMFDNIAKLFKNTDVDVVVGFRHHNGEITKTLSTIE